MTQKSPVNHLKDVYGENTIEILIVEDAESHFLFTSEMLRFGIPHPTHIDWAVDYEQAMNRLTEKRYDVCLVDYNLGDAVGTKIIQNAQKIGCRVPMILLTGHGDRDTDLEAMSVGAIDYLNKSTIKPESLERAVRYAIRNARANEQAQALVAHEERQRLARDLHDAVSQTLFSANVIAETLPRLFDTNADAVRAGLNDLADLTRSALSEMRTLLVELRPKAIIETELDVLFEHLIGGLKSRTPSKLFLNKAGNRYLLPPETQIALYRIAQESINNAIKHAQAQHIRLELVYQPEEVQMIVSDNGIGFETTQIPSGHMGIIIMAERARTGKIKLDIQSKLNEGTTVKAIWRQKLP